MEEPMGCEGRQGQALRVLDVVAASGFIERFSGAQASCLTLCNLYREMTPVQHLRICGGFPRTLIPMLFPGLIETEADVASRVCPPRRVISVEWAFTARTWPKAIKRYVQELPNTMDEGIFDADAVAVANVKISEVEWPKGTTNISLCLFDQPVDAVVWPEGLERLAFCGVVSPDHFPVNWEPCFDGCFDQSLDVARFPAGLRELYLGVGFDQPIDDVAWPDGLQLLSMPGFNQPIDNVQWPAGLKALEFLLPLEILLRKRNCGGRDELGCRRSAGFNQPLGLALPAGLETLWLSNDFRQSLDDVKWPSGILTLGLGDDFWAPSFNDIAWPQSLQCLFLVEDLEDRPDTGQGFEVVIFSDGDDSDDEDYYGDDVLDACYEDEDEDCGYHSASSDFSL